MDTALTCEQSLSPDTDIRLCSWPSNCWEVMSRHPFPHLSSWTTQDFIFSMTKGTKDIRMHPPRRKTACLVLHRCVLGRCPGPLSTAQGKPSLTTVRRSHCHGFALPSPTLPYIDIHCLHCHTSPPLSCVCPTNSASPRKEMTQSVSSSSKSCEL